MRNARPRLLAGTIALLASTVFVPGCRDGTGPAMQGASVRIFNGAVALDEQTMGVGETLQLTGNVRDAGGRTPPNQTVTWSSTEPEVARIDGAGVVEAKAIGSTLIIATHSVGADTVRINVAAFVTGPIECSADQSLSMQVGEIRHFTGDQAVLLCLPGGATTSAAYTIVSVNAGTSAASTLPVQIRASGVTNPVGGPSPTLISDGGTPAMQLDTRFHDRIRREASRALEPRLRLGTGTEITTGPSMQVAVNQTVSYNTQSVGDPCTATRATRWGRIRAVSEKAIVVADTLNPAGGYTTADYEEFARFFDQHAWPLVTTNFGEPSDLDRNGKVVIFFTAAVNELEANGRHNQGSYVGGYFFNRDLFAKSGSGACAGSNSAEMFYMLVPDPTGIHGREFRYDFVKRSTPGVLVHEFQHLVNDSRRLHVNKVPAWEETWMNEGLSHIAEELMFYRAAQPLGPRQEISAASLSTPTIREAFRTFQLDNIDRFTSFLQVPQSTSAMGPDLLATRGASWAYLRYVADRRAGDEAALWRALVRDSKLSGVENLRVATNADPLAWMNDWAVAIYVDDTFLPVSDPRYQMPSWNFRNLYPGLGTAGIQGTFNRTYPLHVTTLISNSPVPVTLPLLGGSAGYVRAGVAVGQRGAVRMTVGSTTAGQQLPPPSRLKVTVVRTR